MKEGAEAAEELPAGEGRRRRAPPRARRPAPKPRGVRGQLARRDRARRDARAARRRRGRPAHRDARQRLVVGAGDVRADRDGDRHRRRQAQGEGRAAAAHERPEGVAHRRRRPAAQPGLRAGGDLRLQPAPVAARADRPAEGVLHRRPRPARVLLRARAVPRHRRGLAEPAAEGREPEGQPDHARLHPLRRRRQALLPERRHGQGALQARRRAPDAARPDPARAPRASRPPSI